MRVTLGEEAIHVPLISVEEIPGRYLFGLVKRNFTMCYAAALQLYNFNFVSE